MPKQGPKKITRRDDRDAERKAKHSELQQARAKADLKGKVLNEYNLRNNPNLPATKTERRALRAALSAEGISMTVWSSGTDLSCFADIARQRFVNQKYAIPAGDKEGDFEVDPWLQMFLHVPESYRNEVVNKSGGVVVPDIQQESTVPKEKPVKMSRRQAKVATERAALTKVGASSDIAEDAGSDNANDADAVLVEQPGACVAGSCCAGAPAALPVPTGTVKIFDDRGRTLTSDASGNLKWERESSKLSGSNWFLQLGRDGKYTLRSEHGKYLSHCIVWGLVANRSAASDWEHLTIAPVTDVGASAEFTVQTWRGSYLASPDATTKIVGGTSAGSVKSDQADGAVEVVAAAGASALHIVVIS
jgi:hypothetical protein